MDTPRTGASAQPAVAAAHAGPLVSVVVPMHNAHRWVAETIESILTQTYPNLEVIVMDDASTDGGGEIVASFHDPRVRQVRHERNLGQFANVNSGIRHARGPLIAICHADDLYERNFLAEQVSYLETAPEVGAVFTKDAFINPEGRIFGRLELPPEFAGGKPLHYPEVFNGILCYGNSFLRAGSSVVRREVYDAVGLFDDSYGLRGDLEMWLRISRSYPIAILDQHLIRYRWGHENVSKQYERLRSAPEITFAMVDDRLRAGDIALAEPRALAALESRRAEDSILVAANLYTLDRRKEGRALLADVSIRGLVSNPRLHRGRLIILWAALHVLLRLPRVPLVANAFYQRWGTGRG